MSSMTEDQDRLRDELAAYVLGNLSDAERVRVEMRLRESAEARQLLAEYQTLLDLLPHALPQSAPPSEARAWVMTRARSSKAASRVQKQSWWQRLRASLHPLQLGVAAIVAAVMAGLVFWNVQLQQQISSFQQSVNINGRVFSLVGTGAPEASARLYVAPGLQSGELDVSNLPPLPEDRIYQLWFARPGKPTETGGAFRVDAQGQAVAQIVVPVPLGEVSAIAVTEEAAPGVQRPTTKHLLDAKP